MRVQSSEQLISPCVGTTGLLIIDWALCGCFWVVCGAPVGMAGRWLSAQYHGSRLRAHLSAVVAHDRSPRLMSTVRLSIIMIARDHQMPTLSMTGSCFGSAPACPLGHFWGVFRVKLQNCATVCTSHIREGIDFASWLSLANMLPWRRHT